MGFSGMANPDYVNEIKDLVNDLLSLKPKIAGEAEVIEMAPQFKSKEVQDYLSIKDLPED